jgi:hypothetical protein
LAIRVLAETGREGRSRGTLSESHEQGVGEAGSRKFLPRQKLFVTESRPRH